MSKFAIFRASISTFSISGSNGNKEPANRNSTIRFVIFKNYLNMCGIILAFWRLMFELLNESGEVNKIFNCFHPGT